MLNWLLALPEKESNKNEMDVCFGAESLKEQDILHDVSIILVWRITNAFLVYFPYFFITIFKLKRVMCFGGGSLGKEWARKADMGAILFTYF